MVKSLASPTHRLLLFLQQSSVEWCSSLWLDAIRELDPTFRRTIIVVSKFDNRLKVSYSYFWINFIINKSYIVSNMDWVELLKSVFLCLELVKFCSAYVW